MRRNESLDADEKDTAIVSTPGDKQEGLVIEGTLIRHKIKGCRFK